MDTRKILIPVLGSSTYREIERNSFWLARYQPAEVYITEVVLPVGFFKWLFAPFAELLGKLRMSQAEKARRDVDEREPFACTVESFEAPSLLLGIVESARIKQPDIIIILPEIGERLAAAGLEEMKRRLSEIRPFVLIRFRQGNAIRIEPCRKRNPLDFSVIPIRKNKWVV